MSAQPVFGAVEAGAGFGGFVQVVEAHRQRIPIERRQLPARIDLAEQQRVVQRDDRLFVLTSSVVRDAERVPIGRFRRHARGGNAGQFDRSFRAADRLRPDARQPASTPPEPVTRRAFKISLPSSGFAMVAVNLGRLLLI